MSSSTSDKTRNFRRVLDVLRKHTVFVPDNVLKDADKFMAKYDSQPDDVSKRRFLLSAFDINDEVDESE